MYKLIVRGRGRVPLKKLPRCATHFFGSTTVKLTQIQKFEHFEIISLNKPAILLFLPPVLAFFNHSRLNWFNAVNFKDILKFDIILEIIQLSFEEIKKTTNFCFWKNEDSFLFYTVYQLLLRAVEKLDQISFKLI